MINAFVISGGLQCIFGEGDGAVAVGLKVDTDVEINTPVFPDVFLRSLLNILAKTLQRIGANYSLISL